MPPTSSQSALEEEVAYLRAQVEQLTLRVAGLEEREFELVRAETEQKSTHPSSDSSVVVDKSVPAASSLPPLTPERELILQGIGNWLSANLQGYRRGLSGREKLSEGNQYYLVLRNYHGKVLNPILVTRTFSEIVKEVKPFGSPGDSVFIGVPSCRDGRIICQAAGRLWPAHLTDE